MIDPALGAGSALVRWCLGLDWRQLFFLTDVCIELLLQVLCTAFEHFTLLWSAHVFLAELHGFRLGLRNLLLEAALELGVELALERP